MQDISKVINVKWCIICKRYDKWSSLNMLWTISMDKEHFLSFCDHLKRHENLKDAQSMIVKELVVVLLQIIGHDVRMRFVGDRFQDST